MGRLKTYSLKGFTILEMMVTLVLTSIAITITYSVLTFTQKLLQDYKRQDNFIVEVSDLKMKLKKLALEAEVIYENTKGSIVFVTKRGSFVLKKNKELVALFNGKSKDEFHLAGKDWALQYAGESSSSQRLVKAMKLAVEFKKQIFLVGFEKEYDSCSRFKAALEK